MGVVPARLRITLTKRAVEIRLGVDIVENNNLGMDHSIRDSRA